MSSNTSVRRDRTNQPRFGSVLMREAAMSLSSRPDPHFAGAKQRDCLLALGANVFP